MTRRRRRHRIEDQEMIDEVYRRLQRHSISFALWGIEDDVYIRFLRSDYRRFENWLRTLSPNHLLQLVFSMRARLLLIADTYGIEHHDGFDSDGDNSPHNFCN